MKPEIIFNQAENRYEMTVEGHIVFANVRKDKGTLYIDYVFAPAVKARPGHSWKN